MPGNWSLPPDLEEFFKDDPLIMEHPVNILSKTVDGDTLLQRAIQRKRFDFVETLISLGADVGEPGDMGNTALHYAVEKESFCEEVFLLLCKKRTQLFAKNEFGESVIAWAKSSGNQEDLLALLNGSAA